MPRHSGRYSTLYFLDCSLYYILRMSLRNSVIGYTEYNLTVLLYGDNDIDYDKNAAIVQAVHDCINDSERF